MILIPTCYNHLIIHSASLAVRAIVVYSALSKLRATVFCLVDVKETSPLYKKKLFPLVDLRSTTSLP